MAWGDATEWIGFEKNLPLCGKEGVWLIDGKGQVGRMHGMDGERSGTKPKRAVEWDEVWRRFKSRRESEGRYGGGGYPYPGGYEGGGGGYGRGYGGGYGGAAGGMGPEGDAYYNNAFVPLAPPPPPLFIQQPPPPPDYGN